MSLLTQRNTGQFRFNSLTDLRALSGENLKAGEVVFLSSATPAADGSGRTYVWNTSSTDTDDGEVTIKLTDTDTGRLKLFGAFLQSGTGAIPRTMLDKAREWVSALDFDVSADGTTNDSANLQKAIDACIASGNALRLPAGTYRAIDLEIDGGNLVIFGDGYATRILTPSGVTSGSVFKIAKTAYTQRVAIRDMRISGPANANVASPTHTVRGLDIGLFASALTGTRCTFENLVVEQCHTGAHAEYSWNNRFRDVTFAQCNVGLSAGASCNNWELSSAEFVNCRTHAALTSCQGMLFDSPLFQNTSLLATEGKIITLFQSSATLVNPYFEGVSPDGLATVGSAAEAATDPSWLGVFGGQVGLAADGGFQVGSPYAKIVVDGLRHNTSELLVWAGDMNTLAATTARGGLAEGCRFAPVGDGYSNLRGEIVGEIDAANQFGLTRVGGGAGVLTSIPNPSMYRSVQTDTANIGFRIANGLTSGGWHTLVLRCRRQSGLTVSLRAQTSGSTNYTVALDSCIPLTTEDWRTVYVPLVAGDDMWILFSAISLNLEIKEMRLLKGIQLLSDETPYNGPMWHTAAPTSGTWRVGQAVFNKAPAAASAAGWMCSVAGTPGTWVSMAALA